MIAKPSGDELTPRVPHDALSANASSPVLSGNPNAPKRDTPGTLPGEPNSEMPKTGDVAKSGMEDLASTQRRTIGMPEAQFGVTVSQAQLRRAGQDPICGWPACAVAYPVGDPALLARDTIFASGNYRVLDADQGWVTGDLMEPLTRALTVAGAGRADAGEFRALDANSGLLRPPFGQGVQDWSLPERRARDGQQRRE